jgi:Restriction endonuclease NotI
VALRIVEFFGYAPSDQSGQAKKVRSHLQCPFLNSQCTKQFRDGTVSGACTVKLVSSGPVIACPNRLYAGDYRILSDVAEAAFGTGVRLIPGQKVSQVQHDGRYVAVFGKRWGKELRLPQRLGRGGYFVDWILALIGDSGHLREFVAVEIQAIDTTGNYRAEHDAYLNGEPFERFSEAGLNWENVSKRILPQIIYKGHVLRREALCTRGLFFICPTPVYSRIQQRLGGTLLAYSYQPGSLTFRWYDVGPEAPAGQVRALEAGGQFTTTIDQVALAFTAPANLPPAGVYQEAIELELKSLKR